MRTQSDCDYTPPVPRGWGYLTVRGYGRAQELGAYYGNHYEKEAWPRGFNVYLWADALNQRTRATAKALAAGFSSAGIAPEKITVRSLSPCQPDPLFHPFQLKCGKPDPDKLQRFAKEIIRDGSKWVNAKYSLEFSQLYDVLDCYDKDRCPKPLKLDTDNVVNTCIVYSSTCKAPLSWKSQFSYASSASESFLLEYANAMETREVGWGRVNPPRETADEKMRDMLKLHEFYFDKTDRFVRENGDTDHYLASIEGSNLIREILDQIKRKVGQPRKGSCPRASAQSDFVGLIGHDTNLATVGALLGLNWRFDDPALPADTRDIPANDALPAGALVFELRQRSDGTYFVRVEYVAQSLSQMRHGTAGNPLRIAVDGAACVQSRPCEMPLGNFEDLVNRRAVRDFLSTCTEQNPPQQTCLALPTQTTKRSTQSIIKRKRTRSRHAPKDPRGPILVASDNTYYVGLLGLLGSWARSVCRGVLG